MSGWLLFSSRLDLDIRISTHIGHFPQLGSGEIFFSRTVHSAEVFFWMGVESCCRGSYVSAMQLLHLSEHILSTVDIGRVSEILDKNALLKHRDATSYRGRAS